MVLIQATEPARSPLPVLYAQAIRVAAGAAADRCPNHRRRSSPDAGSRSRSSARTIDARTAITSTAPTAKSFCQRPLRDRARRCLQSGPADGDDRCCSRFRSARADDFPVGVYRVSARVQPPGEPTPRETNRWRMTLAPQMTSCRARSRATAPARRASRSTSRRAARRTDREPGARDQQEFAPQPFTAPATSLDFVIPKAPVGEPSRAPAHRRHRQPDHRSAPGRAADLPGSADRDPMSAAPTMRTGPKPTSATGGRVRAPEGAALRRGRDSRERARATKRALRCRRPPPSTDSRDSFGLSAFERDLLLLCAGVEMDAGSPRCARPRPAARRGRMRPSGSRSRRSPIRTGARSRRCARCGCWRLLEVQGRAGAGHAAGCASTSACCTSSPA